MAAITTTSSYINVPKDLLRDCKRDKERLELLAMSIIIKIYSSDSRLKNVNYRTVSNVLGCGYYKAIRLIDLAKADTEFFCYDEKRNDLVAKDFKKKYIRIGYTHTNIKTWSMYAIKLPQRKYSLKELCGIFKQELILCAINACDRADEFESKKDKTNNSTSSVSRTPLTYKKLAKIAGFDSTKSVQRTIKRLKNAGRLSVIAGGLVFFTSCSSDEALKYYNADKGFYIVHKENQLYAVKRQELHISLYNDQIRFTNIIFNHSKRTGSHAKHETKVGLFDSEKDFEYWNSAKFD